MQRRATKYIFNLGFVTNDSYTARFLQLDLLPVSYWHEYLDLIFLYKIINNHTYIDKSALPIMAGSGITRSETDNLIKFVIPFAKTVTYQSSYFIRSCKTWNILSRELRKRDISIFSCQIRLKSYYKQALLSTFDLDDPRTWKSVCIKCKRLGPSTRLSTVVSCPDYNIIVSLLVLVYVHLFCSIMLWDRRNGETCGECPGSLYILC